MPEEGAPAAQTSPAEVNAEAAATEDKMNKDKATQDVEKKVAEETEDKVKAAAEADDKKPGDDKAAAEMKPEDEKTPPAAPETVGEQKPGDKAAADAADTTKPEENSDEAKKKKPSSFCCCCCDSDEEEVEEEKGAPEVPETRGISDEKPKEDEPEQPVEPAVDEAVVDPSEVDPLALAGAPRAEGEASPPDGDPDADVVMAEEEPAAEKDEERVNVDVDEDDPQYSTPQPGSSDVDGPGGCDKKSSSSKRSAAGSSQDDGIDFSRHFRTKLEAIQEAPNMLHAEDRTKLMADNMEGQLEDSDGGTRIIPLRETARRYAEPDVMGVGGHSHTAGSGLAASRQKAAAAPPPRVKLLRGAPSSRSSEASAGGLLLRKMAGLGGAASGKITPTVVTSSTSTTTLSSRAERRRNGKQSLGVFSVAGGSGGGGGAGSSRVIAPSVKMSDGVVPRRGGGPGSDGGGSAGHREATHRSAPPPPRTDHPERPLRRGREFPRLRKQLPFDGHEQDSDAAVVLMEGGGERDEELHLQQHAANIILPSELEHLTLQLHEQNEHELPSHDNDFADYTNIENESAAHFAGENETLLRHLLEQQSRIARTTDHWFLRSRMLIKEQGTRRVERESERQSGTGRGVLSQAEKSSHRPEVESRGGTHGHQQQAGRTEEVEADELSGWWVEPGRHLAELRQQRRVVSTLATALSVSRRSANDLTTGSEHCR